MIYLPDYLLRYLLEYLTVNDILNLRLTCSRIFQVSKCKTFYGKVQICMSKINVNEESFQKLCGKFARTVRFNTEGCSEEQLGWILRNAENIKDILINIRYLKKACREFKYIKHLAISYIYTDGLTNDDIDFSCLSMAKELDQLSIKGTLNNFQKLYLDQSMLYDLLNHTKQISKIHFNSICVENEKSFNQDSLSKKMANSGHITEWHLKNVAAPDGIFNFPEDIRILECRNTECINFRKYKYDKIQKLSLESVKFDNTVFKFENLKILEITGHLRGDGLDGRTVICPKLEVLRLFRIHHITRFQNLLTGELKILHIGVIGDISNAEIAWILRNKSSIKIITSHTDYVRRLAAATYGAVPGKSKIVQFSFCHD